MCRTPRSPALFRAAQTSRGRSCVHVREPSEREDHQQKRPKHEPVHAPPSAETGDVGGVLLVVLVVGHRNDGPAGRGAPALKPMDCLVGLPRAMTALRGSAMAVIFPAI